MNKKATIEQQINKTLEQFEQADALPPNPYFYTRVQARLDEKREQRHLFGAILKPALLTVLLAVNLSTAIWYMGSLGQTDQTDGRQELIELLTGDSNQDNQQINLFEIN